MTLSHKSPSVMIWRSSDLNVKILLLLTTYVVCTEAFFFGDWASRHAAHRYKFWSSRERSHDNPLRTLHLSVSTPIKPSSPGPSTLAGCNTADYAYLPATFPSKYYATCTTQPRHFASLNKPPTGMMRCPNHPPDPITHWPLTRPPSRSCLTSCPLQRSNVDQTLSNRFS